MVRVSLAGIALLVASAAAAPALEVQKGGTQAPAAPPSRNQPMSFAWPSGGVFRDARFGELVFGLESHGGLFDQRAGEGSIWDERSYRSPLAASSLRGRAGQNYGNILFYGTGGIAVRDVPFDDTDARRNRPGLVLGGGAEAALTSNLSGRIEYLRTDFGSLRDVGGVASVTDSTVDMLRFGFNYRF